MQIYSNLLIILVNINVLTLFRGVKSWLSVAGQLPADSSVWSGRFEKQ